MHKPTTIIRLLKNRWDVVRREFPTFEAARVIS